MREKRNRPSWLHLEKEGNSISHFQWALDYMPGIHGDNIPMAKLASGTDKHQIPHQDFPTPKRIIIPCVVNHLCNLYSSHWCRLQCIPSWPFWLWIMAVTWLYLPLTLSRLGLKNLGMWTWALKVYTHIHICGCTLKLYKVFTKVGQCPWIKRKLCLGSASVINCPPLSMLSFWVSLFPRVFGYNNIS